MAGGRVYSISTIEERTAMTSITVALDEQSAEQAERAASERRTTLERLIRDYVDQLAASKARFERLAAEWRREAGPLSSSTDRAMLPAYQAIIGMGRTALPFIFEELRQRGGHWFWALRAITGENPVPPEHRGNVEAMTQDWLRWACDRGCI
jgi:hypothetical protein